MPQPQEDGRFYKLGQPVTAKVIRVLPFGLFAQLPDGTEAYVRKKELTLGGTLDPCQSISEGESIEAIVIAQATDGRNLELSVRRAAPDPWVAFLTDYQVRDSVEAIVKRLSPKGVVVQVMPGVDGFIPLRELAPWPVDDPNHLLWIGDHVEAIITHLIPEKRQMTLSVRRQIEHVSLVESIAGCLHPDQLPPSAPEPESETPDLGNQNIVDLHSLGRVLVLNDHEGVQKELIVWLKRHNCRADGAGGPDEALEQVQHTPYDLALIDLDLETLDGLTFIHHLRETSPETPVIVMSVPEWIAEQGYELERLSITDVFTKPLDMDEVQETLGRLAQGERIGPFRIQPQMEHPDQTERFPQLAETMRHGRSLHTRLEAGLEEAVLLTRAELAILFHRDPTSQQVGIVAETGDLPIDHASIYGLSASPVKDLILEGGFILESGVPSQAERRFRRLLDLVTFDSCVGVPVAAAGQVEHALFLFHSQPDAFNHYRLRDARAMAALLGVALESHTLQEQIETINPFLLSGHLAAAFGHDVFNKMSAIELQVRNLKATCHQPSSEEDRTDASDSPDGDPVLHDLGRLLDATLDLKQTAQALRELIRTEDQTAVDVNQEVRQAARLLNTLARRCHVHIELDLGPDLPVVWGSPIRLRQAFLNVMLNGIQHTAEKLERWAGGNGNLKLSTGLESSEEGPLWIRLADNGPGIHAQLWENIFALGFSTKPKGTGLGLFIARSLIESMNGAIYVERSVIPIGTTFKIELELDPAVSSR